MYKTAGQLRDDSLGIQARVYADIVAFEGADERSDMPFDCGLLAGVVRGTKPMSRAKARVSRAARRRPRADLLDQRCGISLVNAQCRSGSPAQVRMPAGSSPPAPS